MIYVQKANSSTVVEMERQSFIKIQWDKPWIAAMVVAIWKKKKPIPVAHFQYSK